MELSDGTNRSRYDPEVIRIANLLLDTWFEAENERVSSSYIATFVDMARAVVVDREGKP